MVSNIGEWRISLSTIIKRVLDSKYSFWLIEIVMVGSLVYSLVSVWTTDVTVDIQYIPEIMSGLTSGTAILIGFTATCLTIMRKFYAKNVGKFLVLLTYLMFPAMLHFFAYGRLVFYSDFIEAIRAAISGFALSLILFLVIVFMAIRENW